MKRIFGLLALVFSLCLPLPPMADAAEKLPAGFIAISDSKMNWADAKAFCQQKAGKLPLIGGSNSLGKVPKGTSVDGFGAVGAPWPTGLSVGYYWTDTESSSGPGDLWIVWADGGNINAVDTSRNDDCRVVCVP